MNLFRHAARRHTILLLSTALVVGLCGAAQAANVGAKSSRNTTRSEHSKLLHAYGRLPLSFIPNAGQTNPRVHFYAQGPGYSFAFTRKEAVLAFTHKRHGLALGLRFVGSSANARLEGQRRLAGTVNYLLGNDRTKWRTSLPTYGTVAYRNLWPGVDMVFKGGNGRLKYEFLVRPGAHVPEIGLAYRGADGVALDRRGNLRIRTLLGLVTDTRPLSYQVVRGRRMPVESRFVLREGGAYGFAVGDYNPRSPLVIDPGLLYSTFLGGSATDQGLAIAVDAAGDAYVTGLTGSTNFPTTAGAFHTTYYGGTSDAFVTKLNPAGTGLVYSTYLGGSGTDEGHAIAVDQSGAAYVTGFTTSTNFPTAAALPPPSVASDTSYNGGQDAFVTKVNPAGTGLSYSTYLGGSNNDQGLGIAVNTSGEAYVTGFTESTQSSFPFTPAALDNTANGGQDAFLTVVNQFGTGNAYSSFLGGSGDDQGLGIALDPNGDAFLTGQTTGGFPTTAGAFDTSFNGAPTDAFVTRFNFVSSGLSGDVFVMTYSTYLGGGGDDRGFGIGVDGTGNAYVTGRTQGLPTTPGAFDTSQNGSFDAFVTKFNPAGTAPLLYSTYLGGGGNDQGRSIAVDAAGDAHVTGRTGSTNFPTSVGAYDTSFNGVNDAFVTKLNPTGTAPLIYSTYLGGGGDDQGFGLAIDATGAVYATGLTGSADFPTTTGAADTSFNGVTDAFVTKLLTIGAPASLMLTPATATNPVGTPHTVTATVRDAVGQPVPGVTVRFSVTGANTASGFCVTEANGQCAFTYTGTHSGTDAITAYADTNNDNLQEAGEPTGAATKIWTPGAPATLTLMPATATNTVGEQHCVTATVLDAFGNPVPGITVLFSVPTHVATFAHPFEGSDTTDANGEATFCFTASLPGMDDIHAYADTNNSNTQDLGEPFDDATKIWMPPASTAFCEVTITNGGWIYALNGDNASFGGNAKVSDDGSTVQGNEEYQDHGPADARNVSSIELLATTCTTDTQPQTATIFGRATIDGAGDFFFRIDVTDAGVGGSNDSYSIIMSDGYDSGQQQLEGGNVTIHKS
jgi:hypothetical protein